jgi:hypothetical protein
MIDDDVYGTRTGLTLQSITNAWWCVTQFHLAGLDVTSDMARALEHALTTRMNAAVDAVAAGKDVSAIVKDLRKIPALSIWHSWGLLVTTRLSSTFSPSLDAQKAVWAQTRQMVGVMDTHSIATLLRSVGRIIGRLGEDGLLLDVETLDAVIEYVSLNDVSKCAAHDLVWCVQGASALVVHASTTTSPEFQRRTRQFVKGAMQLLEHNVGSLNTRSMLVLAPIVAEPWISDEPVARSMLEAMTRRDLGTGHDAIRLRAMLEDSSHVRKLVETSSHTNAVAILEILQIMLQQQRQQRDVWQQRDLWQQQDVWQQQLPCDYDVANLVCNKA